MAGEGGGGHTVHGDAAALEVIEAQDEVDEGGLAAAGGAHDGHPLARLHRQGEVLDQGAALVVAEGDIAEIHPALDALQRPFRVRALLRLVQQGEDPGGAGESVLELRHHGADVVEGLHILVGVGEKHREPAHGEAAAGDQQHAHQGHPRVDDAVDEAGGGVCEAAVEDRLLAALHQLPVDLREALRGPLFIAEGLHHLLPADHLVDEGGLAAPDLALLPEEPEGAGGEEAGHEEAQGRQQHHEKGDGDILGEHEDQGHRHRQNTGEELGEAQQQPVREDVRVRDDPAHDVAGAVAVQIAEGQVLDVPDGTGADVLDDAVGHAVIEKAHAPGAEPRRSGADQDLPEIAPHGGVVHPPGGSDGVDGVAEEDGDIELQDHRPGGQDQARQQGDPAPADEGQQPLHGADVALTQFLRFHACTSFPWGRSSGNWDQ